jgi:hypothetical protein
MMSDDRLKALLSDYAAPAQDDGFSDQLMQRIEAEDAARLDLSDYAAPRHGIRRSWIVALVLGLICGMLWVRLGVSLPDWPAGSELPDLLETDWGLYALFGVALSGGLLFLEADRA